MQLCNGLHQFGPIIQRVDPYGIAVLYRIPRIFQPHERNEFDERQIAVNEIRQFRQAPIIHTGDDDPQFDSHIVATEVIQSEHRFVERTSNLRNSIVVCGIVGMERNAEQHLFDSAGSKFPCIRFIGESTSVRQQMDFGIGQLRLDVADHIEQPVTE